MFIYYQAINILDSAATGSESAKTQLRTLLASTKPRLLRPIIRQRAKPKKDIVACKPTGQGIIENWTDTTRLGRTGRRHRVPTLVSACRFPMLRFQKPQPKNLSRVLRDKIIQRNRRYQNIAQLEGDVVVAEREDAWDRLLARHCPKGVRTAEEDVRQRELQDPESLRWRYAPRRAIAEIKTRIVISTQKARDDSLKMLNIIEREEELMRQEKRQMDDAREEEEKLKEAGKSNGDTKSPFPSQGAIASGISTWERRKAELNLDAGQRQAKVFIDVTAPKPGSTLGI